jgi:hypothetical protein
MFPFPSVFATCKVISGNCGKHHLIRMLANNTIVDVISCKDLLVHTELLGSNFNTNMASSSTTVIVVSNNRDSPGSLTVGVRRRVAFARVTRSIASGDSVVPAPMHAVVVVGNATGEPGRHSQPTALGINELQTIK